MKRPAGLALATVFILLSTSCDTDPLSSAADEELGAAASFMKSSVTGTVFTVPPSGGDDTGPLQAAFDAAVAAGPGSVVQLVSGTYCITSPIIVRGFDGFWLGAGRDETIIQTCADPFPVPVSVVIDPAFPNDPPSNVGSPFLFVEVEGKPSTNLHVADLTIHTKGVTNTYFRHGGGTPIHLYRSALQIIGKRPTVVDGDISRATVTVNAVNILGSTTTILGFPVSNSISAIKITGPIEEFSQFPGDISDRNWEGMEAVVNITNNHIENIFLALEFTFSACTSCPS